jgi:hypothetical protein
MSEHRSWCPNGKLGISHTDPAKRMFDAYNIHRIAENYDAIGKWVAVRLVDGYTDNVLYTTKSEAIAHQHHNEQLYVFVRITPATMHLCEAEVTLATARKIYDKGLRLVDPDSKTGGPDLIKRTSAEDQLAQMLGYNTNLVLPGRDF